MFRQLKWLECLLPTRLEGISAHVRVRWLSNNKTECNFKNMSSGGLTSRGRWSQHDPSSATQGRSLLMSGDFQRGQTPSPPSPHRGPSGSPPQRCSQCSGSGCRLGPPLQAHSCSPDCCPRRCGPEFGTGCRTPLCRKDLWAQVPRQRRRRCRCRGSRRRC